MKHAMIINVNSKLGFKDSEGMKKVYSVFNDFQYVVLTFNAIKAK